LNKIMTFIEGYDTGDTWEELMVSCYQLRYQDDHYTPVPSNHKGDAGIEGFTQSGVVHQSYCPERSYTDSELYNHLRDKLTDDIKKLKENGTRLSNLGVPPIVEWHFNIPEYRDARIISHAQTKKEEVLNAKKSNPADFKHISEGFKIIIKTAESFTAEVARLVRTNLMNMKLNLSINQGEPVDWEKCDSEKAVNIRRKIKAVMLVSDDTNAQLNDVVKMFIEHYMRGVENMTRLRSEFADVYESIIRLELSYKNEVSRKTNMILSRTLNGQVFEGILSDFEARLSQEFPNMFDTASIMILRDALVAKWLADCDMEFRGIQDGA